MHEHISEYTVNALSRDQHRKINRGLQHIFSPNTAEIYRGLGWGAKTEGLVQRAQSGLTTSGRRDLQGAGCGQTHRFHFVVCDECLAKRLMAWLEGDVTNQSGPSQPSLDLMF